MIYILEPYPKILSLTSELNRLDLFSEEDMQKASRYVHTEDRDRFIAARLLLYIYLKIKFPSVTTLKGLSYDRYGKPEFNAADFSFNWSHSGEMIAFIAGDSECGIDVEYHSDSPLFDYRSICTNNEWEWLTSGVQTERFYQLWTAKESVMKALGTGLSLNPIDIEISYDIEGEFTGKVQGGRIYYGSSSKITEGRHDYSLSWCTDQKFEVRPESASTLFRKLYDQN